MNNLTMEIIYSEQFKRANIRFSGKPAEEIREELKKEGWFYSRNHNVWYPKNEAVENSQSFVLQIKEKYFPENQEVKIITEASEKDELVSMIQNDSSLNDILSKVIDMYGEDAVHEAFAQVKEEIESEEMNAELPRLDAEVEDMERANGIREMDDGMTDSIQDYHSELVNLGYKIIDWEDGSGHILDSNGKEIVAWDKSTSEYQWAGKSWTYAEFDWPDFEKEIYLNFKEIRTAQGKFGDIVRGTFLALSDEEKENGTTVEQKNTRYEKWFRPMVDEIMAEIGNGNKEVMAIVQNFDLNHESHVQGNKWYSPDEAYTYNVQYKLLPKMYEKVQDRIKKEYEEKKIPYVVMYSSESPKFPSENKVYTVKEFNEILLQADSEFHNRKKYAEEKYGSADNYWDLERDDKLPEEDKGIQFGYDKTNFKFFNIPNPNNPEDTFSYEPSRYDIGDGNGSVFDYVRSTCSHNEFIEALNALETQLYFPGVTDSQRQFVEKTVEEATVNLKVTLKEKIEDLDKAQNEYKELHKKWLIEATEADRVDEMLKNALDGIKETYDSSMNDVFTKVLNEYPFASGDVAGSEFLKYTANEVKKMAISELYLPSRNAQKSMNAEDYKTYNSIDWAKLRRIWEKFPANVNMTSYAEKLLQDKCNEKGMSVPELKTYHTLNKEDVENLQVISDEEFSDIVDSIILNDYKNIPNVVRLPNIKEELSEKLGLEKDSAFILKKSATHIRPDRKGGYGQAFDTEEYRMIPSVIRNADFAVVDNTFKNFQLIFDDKDDETKINKIIFNKDELGNYLVTIGKVDRESAFSEERNTVVAVGVAPTIQTLRERASSTALRASTTTVESNISLSEEKSTEFNRPAEPLKVYTFSPFGYEGTIVQVETEPGKVQENPSELKWERQPLYSKQDENGEYHAIYDEKKEYVTLEIKQGEFVTFTREPIADENNFGKYSLKLGGNPLVDFENGTIEEINSYIQNFVQAAKAETNRPYLNASNEDLIAYQRQYLSNPEQSEVAEKMFNQITKEFDYRLQEQRETMSHSNSWSYDFPPVYYHALYYGDSVNGKEYKDNIQTALLVGKAKRGDVEAAAQLINESVQNDIIVELKEKYPDAIICAVDGLEASGHNMIPLVYQKLFSDNDFEINKSIVQKAKAHHTGADSLDKLLSRVRFDGEVQKDKDYILLDDHISSGSTLRDLKDYIEANGGNVVAITTLTADHENYKIQVSKENLEQLCSYGEKLDELLKEYGITDNKSGLTDKEASEIISLLSDGRRSSEIEGGFRKGFIESLNSIKENYLSNQVNYPPLKVYTFSPFGYEGIIVQVETDLRRGIPSHDIVGIADSAAKETRERIRAAFGNSGLEMPAERMLQSLIPTDLRKDSPMDLAMAVGILNEQNHWTGEPVLVLGELELSGRIRPVRGAVAAVNSAKAAGITNIVCDPTTAELLKDIDGIKILSAEDLKDVHEKLQQPNSFSKTNVTISKTSSVEFNNNEWIEEALNNLNMDGHFETIRAIEIAVAGKHNILATGAPGSGKTRLTQTLIPALTPKMTEEESKQITRINSLAGLDLPKRDKLVPPFRMPHQTATIEEICGGGPNCRPGEMSLAHRGTLFMDETAEFRSSVIQMLRVPLENRQITLSRAGRSTSYPADFQLAMAMNPCPCGNFHSSDKSCLCSAHSVEQYWKKISDPLLDRVEIKTFVQKDEKDTRKISVEQMKAAITRAYEIQRKRGVYNSHLSPAQIEQFCTLDKQGIDFVDTVTSREGLSPRKKANLLKTALTIANMDGREQILLQDLQEAHELTNEVFAEQKYKITQEQIDKSYSNEVHEEISVFNKENLKTMENQFNDPGVNAEVISAAEQKRKRILEPILNGERTEMYKSFKNFEDKGVFEIKGAQLKVSKNGGLTPTGWKQLQAAMEIYRSKEFETFRYILIDDKTGEIKEQLAITSHMPNFCNVSKPNNETLKQVISRLEELGDDYKLAVCHNHPSGNTTESSFDRELTDSLDRSLRRNDGTNKFLGHIILDHDTFNLALPSEGRPGNCHWKKIESLQANEADRFVEEQNQDMKFMDSYVDGTHALKEVARQINDTDNWNDDFIPVVFTNADRSITGVQYYSKNFFENDSDKIRTEFQTVAKDAGAIGAFPVITDYLWDKLGKSAADYEAVMKSHVMNDAFTDVAFNHTTMTEKYGIEAGKNYYSFYRDQSDRQIDVDATWTPKVNTQLFPSETVKTKHKNRDAVYER